MTHEEGYSVDLLKLPVGHYDYEFTLDSEYFTTAQYSELPDGQVMVNAAIDVAQHSILLSLTLQGSVKLVCDRCLDLMDYAVDLHKSFRVIFSDDEDDEDTISVSREWARIDLGWLGFEQIIVNLPLVHCHQEGECNPQMQELLLSHLSAGGEQPEE